MDLVGHPVGKERDFLFEDKLFGLMGIGVAPNGDIWICDSPGEPIFPKTRPRFI
jgi:hypothetical protein